MSNATDPAAPPTANVVDPPADGQTQAGQPPADGAGAEGQPAAGGDGKPADDATGADGKGTEGGEQPPADDPPAEGAPEAYEPFTLPEGFVLEDESLEQLSSFGKKHNLSQGAAQEAVDLATGHVQKILGGLQQEHAARVEQWAEQAKADPLVGGPAYDANTKIALEAITKFGDAELTEVLKEYGLGNHPALIRFAYRIGKAGGEAGEVHGMGQEQPGKPANKEAALAARIAAEQQRSRGT